MSKPAILFVFTSADKLLDGTPTGWFLPEAAHPYTVLKDSFIIHGASPKGGVAPVDPISHAKFSDEDGKVFMEDPDAKRVWSETRKIGDVDAGDYVAMFVVGGHGPMIDLAFDKDLGKLVSDFYAAKKPVSAVCHGPAGLLLALTPEGKSILSDISVTSFSNSEEAQTPYNDFINILPFSLEEKLKSLGGKYGKGDDWGVKVVWDGGVLTGQNPASARPLGEKLKEILMA